MDIRFGVSPVDVGYAGGIIVEVQQDLAVADPKLYGQLGLKTVRSEAAAAGFRTAA